MLFYNDDLMHLFTTTINGTAYRDVISYNDRDFEWIVQKYRGSLPLNLRAYHYRKADGVNCYVAGLPQVAIPVNEFAGIRYEEGSRLKLHTRKPSRDRRIICRHNNFVLAHTDVVECGLLAYLDGREHCLLSQYKAVPISLKEANQFIKSHHRHNSPVQGHKFSIALQSVERQIVGVLVAGQPIARHQNDGYTLEIRRSCALSLYHNVNSALLGRAVRIGKEMGYTRFLTYTLLSESGASLKATGFHKAGTVKGRAYSYGWNAPSRPREKPEQYPEEEKQRWILDIRGKHSL